MVFKIPAKDFDETLHAYLIENGANEVRLLLQCRFFSDLLKGHTIENKCDVRGVERGVG